MTKKQRASDKLFRRQMEVLNSTASRYRSYEHYVDCQQGLDIPISSHVRKGKKLIPNPDWINAPYTISYRLSPISFKRQ